MNKKVLILSVVLLVVAMLATPLNGTAQASSDTYYAASESHDGLTVIATITLDKSPQCIAVNEETNRVYVGVDVGVEGGLMVIDGETDKVVAEIPIDYYVYDLDVNPQTNRIYVKGIHGNEDRLTVIDGATNLKVGEIQKDEKHHMDLLAVNPVTNLVYVGVGTEITGEYDQVQVYSGDNLTLITAVNIPGSNTYPYVESVGVAVNPNTNKVYATWTGNSTLYMIDGDTHTITRTVHPSAFSMSVMVNSYTNYLYVYGTPYVQTVLNGETLEEVMSTNFNQLRAIDPIHNLLYATEYETGGARLYRINGTTHSIIDSLLLRDGVSYTDPIAVNPKTSKIYFAGYSNQTYVVNASPMKDSAPILSILSPENKTYDVYNVPLNFTTSETLLWAQYCLDGQANQTTRSIYSDWNTTLYGLSEGKHTIIVYGEDLGENVGKSQLIQFRIGNRSSIDPILVIVLIAIALAAAVPALIWRKRRKRARLDRTCDSCNGWKWLEARWRSVRCCLYCGTIFLHNFR